MESEDDTLSSADLSNPDKEVICLNDSKPDSDGENIEAIKKFIEEQEKEIQELQAEVKPCTSKSKHDEENKDDKNIEPLFKIEKEEPKLESIVNPEENFNKHQEEIMSVASSVIDVILSESEARLAKKNGDHFKTSMSSNENEKVGSSSINNSVSLAVGSSVEAKDFSEQWHPAKIMEVDYDEMEVLVHYDNVSKKYDEWISVSSPRLRPIGTSDPQSTTPQVHSAPVASIGQEPKTEEKRELSYSIGERCLARWRDNKRFTATVISDLGNRKYEVMFDDGFRWMCSVSRLYKFKDVNSSSKIPTDLPEETGPIGPISQSVGSSLPYHKHLFDPARDYLGSKSERREMKRKLNIKEIFNIGKKKRREPNPHVKLEDCVKLQKTKLVRKRRRLLPDDKNKLEIKSELPEAVASIIGTTQADNFDDIKDKSVELNTDTTESVVNEDKVTIKQEKVEEVSPMDIDNCTDLPPETVEYKTDMRHDDVIDKIKESIMKLEGDIEKAESPVPPSENQITEIVEIVTVTPPVDKEKKKNASRIKKAKKLRLLQERKVKKEVEKVKSELEAMKTQLEEMKKQVGLRTEELFKKNEIAQGPLVPENLLASGEWSCKWFNGQPVGPVSEIECDSKDSTGNVGLPRRSVQVEDNRLPPGWTKHMVRRSLGTSAGKWDVVLVSPDNKRFHTKTDMRHYLESVKDESLMPYEYALLDFGVHRKLAKRLGWDTFSDGGREPLPSGTLSIISPIIKRKRPGRKKKDDQLKSPKRFMKKKRKLNLEEFDSSSVDTTIAKMFVPDAAVTQPEDSIMEDGSVYVGSLKVQVIDTLLRCPADGCYKNFRNKTLLSMHIKHYHRDLRKMIAITPKVSELAYARAAPNVLGRKSHPDGEQKVPKLKINKKRIEDVKPEVKEIKEELIDIAPTTPPAIECEKTPKPSDSPRLRNALTSKPVKRPKVLLPVRKPEDIQRAEEVIQGTLEESNFEMLNPRLDFEASISTHTVTKPLNLDKTKKKKKTFAKVSKVKPLSDDEEGDWCANSDFETRSSFPRSGTPDSKIMDKSVDTPQLASSTESVEDPNLYMYTETGERVKIERMKREEIINCHCGFREEDGLMIQCELCLCWQHSLCHNIQKESEVPEKYTCSICLNPRRGRRSQRFLHDQDRLYEGLLPGAKPCESLKRSHELSGNLLRIESALNALRIKYYVATKKNHPKLYLWAKDWENGELNFYHDKMTEYMHFNAMISDIGKENLPLKTEDMSLDTMEDPDGDKLRDTHLGSLSGLLSSPGANSLEMPISTSDLERLAKSVQDTSGGLCERGLGAGAGPQPEAAIENGACRERLLRHIQRCQAQLDARLDSIEAQVAELESQDPSFEDDETADYFPRTKQTIQMLLRDLDVMDELGVIT